SGARRPGARGLCGPSSRAGPWGVVARRGLAGPRFPPDGRVRRPPDGPGRCLAGRRGGIAAYHEDLHHRPARFSDLPGEDRPSGARVHARRLAEGPRRERDSNPRYLSVHTISNRAPSATRASLRNAGSLGGFLKPPAMRRSTSGIREPVLGPLVVIQFSETSRGEGGSRTHVGLAPKPDFESGAFGHSATSPIFPGPWEGPAPPAMRSAGQSPSALDA